MLVVGQTYKRSELHRESGGSPHGRVSPSAKAPLVFLFASDDWVGWDEGIQRDDTYWFLGEGQKGEGQKGERQLVRGNRAIASHRSQGKTLHLFETLGKGQVNYVGQAEYLDHHMQRRWKDPEGELALTLRLRILPPAFGQAATDPTIGEEPATSRLPSESNRGARPVDRARAFGSGMFFVVLLLGALVTLATLPALGVGFLQANYPRVFEVGARALATYLIGFLALGGSLGIAGALLLTALWSARLNVQDKPTIDLVVLWAGLLVSLGQQAWWNLQSWLDQRQTDIAAKRLPEDAGMEAAPLFLVATALVIAPLPLPSEYYTWLRLGVIIGGGYGFWLAGKNEGRLRRFLHILPLPLFGIARLEREEWLPFDLATALFFAVLGVIEFRQGVSEARRRLETPKN